MPNTILGDGYIQLPSDTTANRPATPSDGMIRYNTSTNYLEYYSSGWKSVSVNDGSSSTSAASSAAAIKALTGTNANGLYWIDLGNGQGASQVYCIMDSNVDGGGWMVFYGTPSGATSQTYRVTADRQDISVAPITGNYSLSYAKRSGLRAKCTLNKSLVYIDSSSWMRMSGYIWDSTTTPSTFSYEFTTDCATANGTTDSSIRVGMINYNNATGGDFGIGVDSLDHHSPNYYNLNSSCVSHYLYQYGSGYKNNGSLSGFWTSPYGCASVDTNQFGFLLAMK